MYISHRRTGELHQPVQGYLAARARISLSPRGGMGVRLETAREGRADRDTFRSRGRHRERHHRGGCPPPCSAPGGRGHGRKDDGERGGTQGHRIRRPCLRATRSGAGWGQRVLVPELSLYRGNSPWSEQPARDIGRPTAAHRRTGPGLAPPGPFTRRRGPCRGDRVRRLRHRRPRHRRCTGLRFVR